jgi:hypothetical protein
MTASEFVLDTLAFYEGHPERLALDQKGCSCLYRTEDGRKCAIGRWLVKYDGAMEWHPVAEVLNRHGREILDLRVRDLPLKLFQAAQDWHDCLGMEPDLVQDARNRLLQAAGLRPPSEEVVP